MLQWMTTNYVKEELEEEDNQETTKVVKTKILKKSMTMETDWVHLKLSQKNRIDSNVHCQKTFTLGAQNQRTHQKMQYL